MQEEHLVVRRWSGERAMSAMVTRRRPPLSFSFGGALQPSFQARRTSCCAAAVDPTSPPPSQSDISGGTTTIATPQKSAKLSIVRVRELEVRAGARSATLCAEEAENQLATLSETAPAEHALKLCESLEMELKQLKKLSDKRLDDDIIHLEEIALRARTVLDSINAAEAVTDTRDMNADPVPTMSGDQANATSETPEVAEKIRRGVRRGGVELARRAKNVRSGVGSTVAEFVRDDGTIDFKGLRALLSSALDRAGNVWMRLNGRTVVTDAQDNERFPPVIDEEEMFRLREVVSELERSLREESRKRESVLRREDQLGKLIRAKEIRAMDDSVTSVRRSLAVRVLQLEMEKIFGSLADEVARSSLLAEQRLLIAEFGELDERLLEWTVFIDNGEPLLVRDDALGEVANDIQYLKTRLGLDGALYTSQSLDWVQAKQLFAVGWRKTRAGLEFYSRGFRLFVGDLVYASKLIRRVVWGYTPTPREVRTLRRTGRDMLTLVPFTIILIAPLTPVGHVLVFSFLQRNWPDFFPSTFSERRQSLMVRYENYAQNIGVGVNGPGLGARNNGVLRKFLFFWRGFADSNAKTESMDNGKSATGAAREKTPVREKSSNIPERTLSTSPSVTTNDSAPNAVAIASDVELSRADDASKSNGVAKSPTSPTTPTSVPLSSTTPPTKKEMGIDDLHLAD